MTSARYPRRALTAQIPLLLEGVGGVSGRQEVPSATRTAAQDNDCADFTSARSDGMTPPLGAGLPSECDRTDELGGATIDAHASPSHFAYSCSQYAEPVPPNPGEPWLPLKEREGFEDSEIPAAVSCLPPPAAPLLPPPPPPRPPYDPSAAKPPVAWSTGGHVTALPYPSPSPDRFHPPMPTGMMFHPPLLTSIPIMPPWVHGPSWYPAMAAPVQHPHYLYYHPHPFHPGSGHAHPGFAMGGVDGHQYAPAAAAAAVAAAQAGIQVVRGNRNSGAFSPVPVDAWAAVASAETAPPVGASAAVSAAKYKRQPRELPQQHRNGAFQINSARSCAGRRAGAHTSDAALSTRVTAGLTASPARWAEGIGKKRPHAEAASSLQPNSTKTATTMAPSAAAAVAAAVALAAAVAAATAGGSPAGDGKHRAAIDPT